MQLTLKAFIIVHEIIIWKKERRIYRASADQFYLFVGNILNSIRNSPNDVFVKDQPYSDYYQLLPDDNIHSYPQ